MRARHKTLKEVVAGLTWLGAHKRHDLCGRDPREGHGYDLVARADAHGAQDDLDGCRATRAGDRVARARVARERVFELPDLRAHDERGRVEHRAERARHLLLVIGILGREVAESEGS